MVRFQDPPILHLPIQCPPFPHLLCYFFLSRFTRDRIPISSAGIEINRSQERTAHSNEGEMSQRAMKGSPARAKAITPAVLFFHEINQMANSTSEGKLIMSKVSRVCQKPPPLKASVENEPSKRMKRIERIRGAQYTNLLIFFGIFFVYFVDQIIPYSYLIQYPFPDPLLRGIMTSRF